MPYLLEDELYYVWLPAANRKTCLQQQLQGMQDSKRNHLPGSERTHLTVVKLTPFLHSEVPSNMSAGAIAIYSTVKVQFLARRYAAFYVQGLNGQLPRLG